jgi:ABC-type glycerol-3-phosphate transport system permease component
MNKTAQGPPSPSRFRSTRRTILDRLGRMTVLHLVLAALSLTLTLPFVWMVLTSLKELDEVGLETWLPRQARWGNYPGVFQVEQIRFARWYVNSIFVAAAVTFLQVLTSAMAAFSFSRLKWVGRDRVFLLYLGTMMLPGLVMMIPNYQIMIRLGLVDTYMGLIIPAAFSAFGTFLLRQFMMTIPTSLDEAAEIDGAGKWQLFWDVILPLARPGLVTLAIFTFIGNYHSFFWPLVMMKSVHRYTLPIGLLFFESSQGEQTNLLMAAITMSVVPMILLFAVLQKQLVRGIQLGAIKG